MIQYWSKFGSNLEVNRTEDIIKEAIKQLEDGTKGKIKGKFTQIIYKSSMHSMQEYISQIFGNKIVYRDQNDKGNELREIPNVDMENIDNIEESYSQEIFSFEIYSDKYKFRIMQVINSVAFPVRVVLDEGIAKELNMTKPAKEINSNEQMENFLVKVLATNKVNNVVNQMLVLLETESEEKIKEYLITQPMGDTLAGIAKGINWSQRLTLNRLRELEKNGYVEEVKLDGKHKFWMWKKGVYS